MDYKKLKKKLKKMKKKSSKVRQLLEEFSIKGNITPKDSKIIHEALVLQEQMDVFRKKIIFRLGEKEMLNFVMDIKMNENK